jgi:hypothetical protein
MLTGEVRPYDRRRGAFGMLDPDGALQRRGFCSWESAQDDDGVTVFRCLAEATVPCLLSPALTPPRFPRNRKSARPLFSDVQLQSDSSPISRTNAPWCDSCTCDIASR